MENSKRRICEWRLIFELHQPKPPPAHLYAVQILSSAVWFRKYESIFSRDMQLPRTAGQYVEFEDMKASQSARSLGAMGEVIMHCVVKRDMAKCRDQSDARLPEKEHLILTAGRSGPGILLPCCKRQYIRPEEHGHDVLSEYLSGFSDIVMMMTLSRCMVWLTLSFSCGVLCSLERVMDAVYKTEICLGCHHRSIRAC